MQNYKLVVLGEGGVGKSGESPSCTGSLQWGEGGGGGAVLTSLSSGLFPESSLIPSLHYTHREWGTGNETTSGIPLFWTPELRTPLYYEHLYMYKLCAVTGCVAYGLCGFRFLPGPGSLGTSLGF